MRITFLFAVLALSLGCAQAAPSASDPVVDAVVRQLDHDYVFPAMARQAGQALRAHQRAGRYRALEGEALGQALTADLRAVTRDKHLDVRFSRAPLPEFLPEAPQEEDTRRFLDELRSTNFGVVKAERMEHNIGYLELRAFAPAPEAGGAIAAAMSLLQHTDALVIDLRANGGGDPFTVALLASYLLDPAVELNAMYWREGDRTQQFWTSAWLPGPRYGASRPVYLLTSSRTFSAAEDFAYALANLKRATIVGEASGGGAHPGRMVRLAAHYEMFVPTGRSISPVTGANWEGVGVQPQLKAAAADALEVALADARKRLGRP